MNQRYDDFMGGTIPDYTQHEAERREAAARTREAKVHLMNPTIHVQLQVRKIVAQSYESARVAAYHQLEQNEETYAIMVKLNAATLEQFAEACRVAKEVDGTYTVTLP